MARANSAMTGPQPVESVSIVIPVYNERDTWRELLDRVRAADAAGLTKQILLVDDGSTDGTRDQLRRFADAPPDDGIGYRVVFHEHNRGKGAALRTGFKTAGGDIVIIQDADLEYDPADYPALFAPLIAGEADVVYGSRFARGRPPGSYLSNYLANRLLSALSSWTTGLTTSDMETCYKVFRRDVLRSVRLEQDRFGFEPEITARIAAVGVRFAERPIRYAGRSHAEGKKITWRDGLKAIWCIFKYGLSCRHRTPNRTQTTDAKS